MTKQRKGTLLCPQVVERAGLKVLLVGGVIQSIGVDGTTIADRGWDVWDALIPEERPRNALVLGVGGGTVIKLLEERFGAIPITGVEKDADILALARTEFGLGSMANVELILSDAFAYLMTCQERFDLIIVDLYVADRLAHGVLAYTFLREVASRLTPDGIAAFNFIRTRGVDSQLHRLHRVFAIKQAHEIERNIVLHCRAKRCFHREDDQGCC